MKILQIIIPKRMKDQRIDMALSQMIPDYSRSKITAWIKSGEALINNKTFKPKDKVNGNESWYSIAQPPPLPPVSRQSNSDKIA